MQIWFYTIFSILVISSISAIGALAFFVGVKRMEQISFGLISFAVGGLLGDAFIHLLPESFQKLGINLETSLYSVAGVLVFFMLEKFIRWRHCHIPETAGDHIHPVATTNLIGDGVHNFVDGVLVAASFMAGIPIGISTTVAVILHEIPQEIGDFAVLLHAGLTVKKAILYNVLSGLIALVGAVLCLFLGSYLQDRLLWLLPVTAGGFIYIAASDLIPELQHEVSLSKSARQFIFIVAGLAVMAILVLLP